MKTTTFRFDEKTMELIEQIRKRTGAASNSEALRMALRVYGTLSEATHDGEKIFLQKDDETKREVLLP